MLLRVDRRTTKNVRRRTRSSMATMVMEKSCAQNGCGYTDRLLDPISSLTDLMNSSSAYNDGLSSDTFKCGRRQTSSIVRSSSFVLCGYSLFPALFSSWPTKLLVCTVLFLCSPHSFIYAANAQYFGAQHTPPPPLPSSMPAAGDPTASDQFAALQQQYARSSMPHPSPPTAAALQQQHSAFSGSVGEGIFARQSALPQSISGGGAGVAGRSAFRLNAEKDSSSFQQNQQQTDSAAADGGGRNGAYTDQSAAVGFKCREPFGHHAVHHNCSMFIVCVFSNPVVQECQGTTVYNHKLGTCDWRHNSECPAPGDGFFAIGQDAQGQQITGIGELPPLPTAPFNFGNFVPPPPPPPSAPKPPSGPYLPPLPSLSNFGASNSFVNNFNQPRPQPPPPPSQQFFQQQQQQSQSPLPTRPPFSIQLPPQSSDFRPPPDRRQQTSPKFDPSAGRNEIVISQSAGSGPPAPSPNAGRNNNDQQSNVGSERLTHRQNQPPPQPPQQPPPRPPSPGIDPKNRSVLTSSMPWWLEQSPTSQQHQQRPQLDITAKSRVPVNAVGSDSPSPTTAASTTSAAPLAASSSNVDTSKHPWWLEPVQPPVLEAAASTREPSAAVIYRPNSLESSTQLLQQHQNIHRQQLADIEKQLLLREKLVQQHQQKQQQPNAQSSNTHAISPWNSPPQNVPQQSQQQQQQQQKRPEQPPSASTLTESESTNKPTHQQLVGRQQQPPTTNYNFKSSQPTLATRDTSYQMQPHYQQRTIVEHVHAKPEYHDIVIPDQRPFWMAPGEQAAAAAAAASRGGGGGGSGARLQQVDGGNVQLVRILPNDHANWHIVPPSAASGDGPPSTVPPSSVAEPPVSNLGARQQSPRHPPSPQPHPPMRPDRPRQPPLQSQQQHRHPPPPPPPGVIGRTFPLAPSPPPPPPPQYQIHPPVFSRTARHTPSAVFTSHSSPMSSVKMLNFSRPSYPEYARPSPLPATIHQFQPQMRKFERFTALHTPAVRAQQKRTQYEQQFSPQPHPAHSPSHSKGFHGRSLIAATPYALTFKQQQQEFAGEPTEPISTRTPRATTHKPWWVSADALSPTVPVGVVRPQQPLNGAPTRESVMYWTPMRPTSAEVEHTASKRRTDSLELPTPPPPAVVELPVVINGAHQQQQQQHNVNSHDITNAARHRYHQRQQQQQQAETARDYLKPWWVDLPSTPMMNPYELHTPMPTTAKPWWIMNWWDAAQHTSPPVLPSYGFTPPYHLPTYLASRPTAAANTAYDGLPLFAAPSLSHWLTVPLQTAISNPNDLFRFSFPTAVVAELPKSQSQQSNNTTANPTSNSTQSKKLKESTQSTLAPMTPHDSRTTTSTTTTTSPPIYFDTSNMNNEMSATWHFVSDIGVTTTTAPTTLQPAQQFFETTAPWWYAEPPLYGTLAPTFEWSAPQASNNNSSSSHDNASNSKQPRSIGIPSHAALIASQVEYAPPIIKHKKSSRPLMIEMNNLFSTKYAGDNNVIRVANSKLFMEPFGPGFKHQQKPWQHDVQQQSEAASANASNTDDMIDTSVVLSSKANVVFSNGGEPARTANFALPSSSATTSNSAAAVDCDTLKCNIPHCWCGSTATPGNFPLSATPQIVLLTFDDALTEQNYQIYQRILRNRTNPNGCPIRATFYISHEWSEYHLIQNLHSDGHEIASHSVSHSLATRNTSKLEWAREIDGQRRILSQFSQIPLDEIRGMRAPYLQPGGNAQYEMLWEQGFLYDSSLSVSENNPPFWPYTLDFRLPHKCWIPPCPTKPYPGLWQVPMVHWEDLLGYRCAMADACHNPGSVEEVYELLTKNFMRHYKSNRAPFGMFYHSAWFMHHYHMKGFEKFLDELLEQPDVWLVSTADAIAWMQQPTPLSHIDQFEPWQCDTKQNKSRRPRTDRLPAEKCTKPSVCPASFRGGMRYLRTCAACPAEYPWLDNPTGARQQHHASSTSTTSSFATASPTPSYL